MDKDVTLRVECLRLACGRCDMNPELNVTSIAQEFYDFCKGNKPATLGVPEDSDIPF